MSGKLVLISKKFLSRVRIILVVGFLADLLILYSMKIKEQTRKLAAGCSKHCFEVVDETDEVSSKHCFEVVDRTDEVSSNTV